MPAQSRAAQSRSVSRRRNRYRANHSAGPPAHGRVPWWRADTRAGRGHKLMAHRLGKDLCDLQAGPLCRAHGQHLRSHRPRAARGGLSSKAPNHFSPWFAFFVLMYTWWAFVGLAAFKRRNRTKQTGATRRAVGGARKFHILPYFLVENGGIIPTAAWCGGAFLAWAAGVQLRWQNKKHVSDYPRLCRVLPRCGSVLLMWIVGWLAVLVGAPFAFPWLCGPFTPAVAQTSAV